MPQQQQQQLLLWTGVPWTPVFHGVGIAATQLECAKRLVVGVAVRADARDGDV